MYRWFSPEAFLCIFKMFRVKHMTEKCTLICQMVLISRTSGKWLGSALCYVLLHCSAVSEPRTGPAAGPASLATARFGPTDLANRRRAPSWPLPSRSSSHRPARGRRTQPQIASRPPSRPSCAGTSDLPVWDTGEVGAGDAPIFTAQSILSVLCFTGFFFLIRFCWCLSLPV
jgi:hypothetical protein